MSDDKNSNKNSELEAQVHDISEDLDDDVTTVGEPEEPAEDFKNQYLYLQAEFQNYKKNMIKERSDLIKYGSERLMLEILNVLDVFDKALENDPTADTFENYAEGIKLTATELRTSLDKFGLQEANPKGKMFDPNIHEALSSFETTDVEDGHIYEVFKKGYKLNGKVIRPAQVVVAIAPKEAPSEEDETESDS